MKNFFEKSLQRSKDNEAKIKAEIEEMKKEMELRTVKKFKPGTEAETFADLKKEITKEHNTEMEKLDDDYEKFFSETLEKLNNKEKEE